MNVKVIKYVRRLLGVSVVFGGGQLLGALSATDQLDVMTRIILLGLVLLGSIMAIAD